MSPAKRSGRPAALHSFDRFLVDGTGNTLSALTGMFGLNIDRSDSTIEITPAVHSQNLSRFGNGSLYVVSSDLVGEMQGSIVLLMRSCDFENLGDVMKPILNLLFLSNSDVDLATLDSQKPDWMNDNRIQHTTDPVFHEQMMDTLAEMGNVIIGLYTKALYKNYDLNTHHSLPKTSRIPDQESISEILSTTNETQPLQLVIENEFVVMNRTIKLWCLISPTSKSFQNMLKINDCPNSFGKC